MKLGNKERKKEKKYIYIYIEREREKTNREKGNKLYIWGDNFNRATTNPSKCWWQYLENNSNYNTHNIQQSKQTKAKQINKYHATVTTKDESK